MSTGAKEIREERQQQRDHDREQHLLREAFNRNGNASQNFIKELLNSEDIVTGGAEDLQEVTVAKIESMLSSNWVLANLTDAQEHDIRYKLEVIKYKVLGAHPPEESVITGPVRAFIFDDPMEDLQPLTAQERILIDELFETLKGRITRGRGGFERKQMNTNIAETRTQKDKEQKSAFRGLFDS